MKKCVRLGAACLLVAAAADACSCVPSPVCKSMWSADAVLTARAIAKGNGDGTNISFTLQVQEVLRGAAPSTVEVWTARQDAMCGYPFQIGIEYLVFMRREGGRLVTGLCTGTKPVADAGEDLNYLLRAGRLPATLSPRPSYVYGRVKLLDRWPMRGTTVLARGDNGDEEHAVTGDNGEFNFYDLPSGRYEVVVEGAARKRVDLTAGSCTDLAIQSRAVAELWGRLLTSGGEPEPASEVRLEPWAGTDLHASTTGKDGRFQFQAPPGRYYLTARPAGEGTVVYYPGVTSRQDATPVDLRTDAGVTGIWFRMPERAVRVVTGKVENESGRPVEKATVYWGGEAANGKGLTGEDGGFRLETTAGRLEVWAETAVCPGVRSLRVRLNGGEATPVLLRLSCGSKPGTGQ
jgi:hypothetical protein